MTTFLDLGVQEPIIETLTKRGYEKPTIVQEHTIPLVLKGNDLLALAETGSGKTAASVIPICQLIEPSDEGIQALIIVPTRELAMQYVTETQKIAHAKNIRSFSIVGGSDSSIQQAKLKSGVDILIATPGRLIDFIYNRLIDLSSVKILVLDEADEMLSMGFYEDLQFIMDCLIQKHQTLLFSATMPKEINILAQKHLINPIEIRLISDQPRPSTIEHWFSYCAPKAKLEKLVQELKKQPINQTIIFAASRESAELLNRQLSSEFKACDFLHGGLTQEIRQIVTNKFRQGKIKYLIATDVAARGLDFSGVSHVFIYQLGKDPEVYLHRTGRTGRQNRSGVAITFISDKEIGVLKKVLEKTAIEPKWIDDIKPDLKSKQRFSLKKNPRKYPTNNRKPSNFKKSS